MTADNGTRAPHRQQGMLTPEEQRREERQIWILVGLVFCGMGIGFLILALSVALDWY